MKGIAITFLFTLLALASVAQKSLLFTNTKTKQEILVIEGDVIKFSYNGYLNQQEDHYGHVLSIKDSVIEMSTPVASLFVKRDEKTRYINVKDITGFRKFHRSRPYLKGFTNLVIAAGTIYLFYIINKDKNDLSYGDKVAISIGTGIIGRFAEKIIFPQKIKNKIGEEWEIVSK